MAWSARKMSPKASESHRIVNCSLTVLNFQRFGAGYNTMQSLEVPEDWFDAWSRWRQLETFSALLALCEHGEGNSPITGQFPSQRLVTRCLDVFIDLRLSKQSRRTWFETPYRSLWCHCNVKVPSSCKESHCGDTRFYDCIISTIGYDDIPTLSQSPVMCYFSWHFQGNLRVSC